MQVISDIQQSQLLCQQYHNSGESIAFVPTMGCLHDGHLSLVEKAQSLADRVVVSIFVNPLQFNDPDDLSAYPRTIESDISKLSSFDIDMLFCPEVGAFYPEGEKEVEKIDLGEITTILEGEQRPGHFAGVATVVKRLFDLVQPDIAVFGEKDFQQLMVIKKLVSDFSLGIEIIGMPTFREPDGLAMSSRNIRLSEEQRQAATEIYRQLERIKNELHAGNSNFLELEQAANQRLAEAGFSPEYVVIRDTKTLLEPQSATSELVVLAAASLGEIRLIDNILL